MADKVRLGVVGTSGWTEMIYLDNLKHDPHVELVGICGRNGDRARELATKYGIASAFTDYRQLMSEGDLDGVIIAPPDDLHLPMTLAAIDAGLHVLCEKPLANSAADARTMLDAAEAAQIKHMVMFTWRWQPHYQYVKSLLDEGAFGRVYRAQFSFIANFSQNDTYQWRLDPMRANGIIGDLGSHMIDLGNWMFGEVSSVSADLGTAVSRQAITGHEGGSGPDLAHVTLRFASGVQGVVDISAVSHDADRLVLQLLRIEGEKAALELEHAFLGTLAGARLRWFGAGEEQSRLLEVPPRLFGSSDPKNFLSIYGSEPVGARGFVAAIRDGTRPTPDFSDGWRAQRVVDAAFQSHRERRWIDLS